MRTNKTRLFAALIGATYFSMANMFKHGSPYGFENAKHITQREPKQDNPTAIANAKLKRERRRLRNLGLIECGGFKNA